MRPNIKDPELKEQCDNFDRMMKNLDEIHTHIKKNEEDIRAYEKKEAEKKHPTQYKCNKCGKWVGIALSCPCGKDEEVQK